LSKTKNIKKYFTPLPPKIGLFFSGRDCGKINREAVQVACFMERQEPEKTGAVF